MRTFAVSLVCVCGALAVSAAVKPGDVTIIRDDWGIAHVYGKTDADAVFGAIYAQAEDDFNRIETNYIASLGRAAEVEGESSIYQDLRMRLFIDPADLRKKYAGSPAWLRTLMDAWAQGLNFYLAKHPDVKPRLIKQFEPWMALSFTEGSIPVGGDIVKVSIPRLEAFYGKTTVAQRDDPREPEPGGSNGIAIAPANTVDHHSLLLINPHTTFYFRSELQMVSNQGLDAYGASTWGQFFLYQGFNSRTGWMHTTSGVDAVDEYLETIVHKDGKLYYKYGGEERPVVVSQIVIPFKLSGGMAGKKFTIYRTHHGPVVREVGGKWVAVKLMQEPVKALEQSFLRTKTRDYKSYLQTMELKANSSNNTIFADAGGDIAYFHGNYIPRRDTRFDWTKPVDGSDPATEYKGLLEVRETPHLLNPSSGWLYNSNNSPWSAAGPSSPRREDYPAYVETGTESARGLHAVRVLENKKDFTIDSLIAAAYDSYLTWFDKPLPELIGAWDAAPDSNPLKAKLAGQIAVLRKWDQRWAVDSVATSLGVFWAEEMRRNRDPLAALAAASDRLTSDFGTWKTPWGEINRFQRITDAVDQPFSDADPSIPVGFTSGALGSIASFAARPYPGTKRWYGTSGNSFVAVVEFGDRVRARAVTAGGESGHLGSKHFDDEARRYATGNLREVYFYRDQLKGHTERTYHPGE
ncbi:MAG: penicillin acylase family protein [Acidobacteriota bacterium]|nr:penicillin acylase family protein [Acidobacteriota bacterium]